MRLQLGATYDLLDASADFGLELLQQCYVMRMKTRPSTTSWVSLLILHRTLELLDGISVLVRACVWPARPLLRSMLESAMYS